MHHAKDTSFPVTDKNVISEISNEFSKQFYEIPQEFNWALFLSGDTEELKCKKYLISSVKNQHLCGCCWAISCVTALSDCFVVKNIVNWAPKISYTYALSKYPQQKCSGGSSRILLEDIKNGDGISSDFCVDDKWCSNNKDCVSSNSSSHFFSKNKEYLSSLIPPQGCYDGNKKHYVYYIDDVYSLSSEKNLKILESQKNIKKHIMVRGPVVGGFLVMKNFLSGSFSKKDSGIYFENEDDYKNKILGSHSVVIVGWGVEKNVVYKNKVTDIPYWYCRNSWGINWGEKGYFKIAMYPYNKICQFSKKINVIHNGKIKEVGGVTGFNVTRKPELKLLKSNNVRKENLQEFYNNKKSIIFVCFLCLIFFVVFKKITI